VSRDHLDCLDRIESRLVMLWQVQEAKQRFSELLRAALSAGPQIVTRHGEEIAVVIDIAEFHRLRGDVADFKDFLRAGPDFDDLDLTRSRELPRELDWGDG
jgi:prevent-host-death family protein